MTQKLNIPFMKTSRVFWDHRAWIKQITYLMDQVCFRMNPAVPPLGSPANRIELVQIPRVLIGQWYNPTCVQHCPGYQFKVTNLCEICDRTFKRGVTFVKLLVLIWEPLVVIG